MSRRDFQPGDTSGRLRAFLSSPAAEQCGRAVGHCQVPGCKGCIMAAAARGHRHQCAHDMPPHESTPRHEVRRGGSAKYRRGVEARRRDYGQQSDTGRRSGRASSPRRGR